MEAVWLQAAVRIVKVPTVARRRCPYTLSMLAILDVLDELGVALRPLLARVEPDGARETALLADLQAQVGHKTARELLHVRHAAGGGNCGVALLGQLGGLADPLGTALRASIF